MFKAEHNTHCKSIVDELYKIVNGDLVHIEEVSDYAELLTDDNGIEYVVYDDEFYTENGAIIEVYGNEHATQIASFEYGLWNYFNDVLDIKYMVNADRTYNGVQLLVTYGGPNIYISTITGKVELYWWTERGEWSLDRCVIEAIDEVFEEYFMCL